MPYETIILTQSEGVALVTLNRPDKRNALSVQMRAELIEAMDELEGGDVKAAVLTGAGETFCAGFDLSEFTADNMAQIFADAGAYHRGIYTSKVPLIAAVNGRAFAGGMDLALMCDLRVAAAGAAFAQPQVKMGIPAAYDLVRSVVPETVARELCLTGRAMAADEALAVGLVNRVASGDVVEEALALGQAVAESQGAAAMKASFLAGQPDLFRD